MTEKSRENKVRRQLAKEGYSLHKSRGNFNIDNHGGYRIVDANNVIVAGERYDMSIDDVEKFASE